MSCVVSCGKKGSAVRVSVFGLRWCRLGVGGGLEQGVDRTVGLCLCEL